MKAILLCAGKGKRMKPYTNKLQKVMIPIRGKPLLEYIVEGIKFAGFKEVVIVVGYLKEQIVDYFQDGSKWDLNIEYVEQKTINGTGGAVLACKDFIKTPHFFLTYGDILVPYKIYKQIYEIHKKEREDFVLVSNYLENIQKGCSLLIEEHYLVTMTEKPPDDIITPKWNNCGIYIFSKEIFEVLYRISPSQRGEIELPDAICLGIKERNWKVRVIKMEKHQFRGDFGDIQEYEKFKKNTKWLKEIYE
ncbi:MAG: sugar phosphate nucleotidyltransferase [Candidatus Hermodarchaeota archaeon]